jgi:hypothetical protein
MGGERRRVSRKSRTSKIDLKLFPQISCPLQFFLSSSIPLETRLLPQWIRQNQSWLHSSTTTTKNLRSQCDGQSLLSIYFSFRLPFSLPPSKRLLTTKNGQLMHKELSASHVGRRRRRRRRPRHERKRNMLRKPMLNFWMRSKVKMSARRRTGRIL